MWMSKFVVSQKRDVGLSGVQIGHLITHNLRLSLFPRNHTILTLRLVKSQLLNQLGLGFDKSIKVVRAAFVATFRRFVFKVGHIKLAGGNR